MASGDGSSTPRATAANRARTRRPARWGIVGAIVAALVLVGFVAVVAVARDDAPVDDTAQIGWKRQSCQQWANSDRPTAGVDDAWCRSMTDWMRQRNGPDATARNGMMRGPMMWRDPDSMRTTCEQWMASDPVGLPGGTDANGMCEEMVDWMNQRMGDWDEWMRNGPMMDGS